MEEGLVGLVENHHGLMITSCLDQILYGPYSTSMNQTFLLVPSQEEGHSFFMRLLCPSVSLEQIVGMLQEGVGECPLNSSWAQQC